MDVVILSANSDPADLYGEVVRLRDINRELVTSHNALLSSMVRTDDHRRKIIDENERLLRCIIQYQKGTPFLAIEEGRKLRDLLNVWLEFPKEK